MSFKIPAALFITAGAAFFLGGAIGGKPAFYGIGLGFISVGILFLAIGAESGRDR